MGAFYCDCMEFMEYRNFVIHGGNSEGKEGLINSVVGYVEEIKSEKTTQRGVHSGVAQKWTPPKQG